MRLAPRTPTTSWSLGDVAPTPPALSGPVLSAVVCGLGSLTGTRCLAGSLELTTSLFLQHKTAYFIPGAALSWPWARGVQASSVLACIWAAR